MHLPCVSGGLNFLSSHSRRDHALVSLHYQANVLQSPATTDKLHTDEDLYASPRGKDDGILN